MTRRESGRRVHTPHAAPSKSSEETWKKVNTLAFNVEKRCETTLKRGVKPHPFWVNIKDYKSSILGGGKSANLSLPASQTQQPQQHSQHFLPSTFFITNLTKTIIKHLLKPNQETT